MNAILLASAGVVILLVGGGVGFWAGRSGVGGSRARVEKAEAELDDYKRSVTEHFDQTAAHFQAIGKQYRELYEHMSSGAQALCELDEAGKRLLFAPDADSASTIVEKPAAEAVIEAEKTGDEQVAEIAGEAVDAETEVSEGLVPETAAQSQPEGKADKTEQTLH
jgi:uncharacterized membrane-anchored protein YhcB (DUF1043 family)